MSAVDGWVLLRYQGARARWLSASAGWWPAVAYHSIARLWQVSSKGTVRRTAAAVRLRAWPVPEICRLGFWIPCEAADAAPLDYELDWPAQQLRSTFHVSQDQIDEAMRAARQLWIDEQQDDTCRAVT